MGLEFTFDDSGLKRMVKKLEHIGDKVDGKHSFNEMFPTEFMKEYTNYSDIDSFMNNCGFPYKTDDEFKAIPDDVFDDYVRNSSKFDSWHEMLNAAGEELVRRELKAEGL